MTELNKIIKEIVDICNNTAKSIILANTEKLKKGKDGRNDGTIIESNIIKLLKDQELKSSVFKKYDVTFKESKIRSWCDFKIKYKDLTTNTIKEEFVDIKATNTGTPDNGASPVSLLYVFTNLSLDSCKKYNRTNYWEGLNQNYDFNNSRNYFYLIINKSNLSNNFMHNLLELPEEVFKANSNNLPFQIKWTNLIIPVKRTKKESFKVIMGVAEKSFRTLENKVINEKPHVDNLRNTNLI